MTISNPKHPSGSLRLGPTVARRLAAPLLALVLGSGGCVSGDDPPADGTGGTSDTGGVQASGGTSNTGGVQASGGTSNTGGNSSGGTSETGGMSNTGGNSSGGTSETGGTSGTGGVVTSNGELVTLTKPVGTLVDALCARSAQCDDSGTLSVERCIASFRLPCTVTRFSPDYLDGSLDDLAEECSATVGDIDCDGILNGSRLLAQHPCQVFMARLRGVKIAAVGEACGPETECDTASYCAAGATPSCGQCVAAPGEGEACGDGHACATDLTCRAGTCQAFRQQGETCGQEGPCDDGLFCSSTCVPFASAGESCASLPCDRDSRCGSDRICQSRGAEGDACTERSDCGSSLICQQETCTSYPLTCKPGKLDGPCAVDGSCGSGMVCSWTSDLCESRPAAGQPCDDDMQQPCLDGMACITTEDSGSTTVCAPKKSAGETCGTGVECLSYNCSGTCIGADDGEYCTEDGECDSGTCTMQTAQEGHCGDPIQCQ